MSAHVPTLHDQLVIVGNKIPELIIEEWALPTRKAEACGLRVAVTLTARRTGRRRSHLSGACPILQKDNKCDVVSNQ
jgi:hypothetical protein